MWELVNDRNAGNTTKTNHVRSNYNFCIRNTITNEYHKNKAGKIMRYKNYLTALKTIDKLNKE